MKKSSEDLRRAQEAMDLRKSLLESGKIRLTPEKHQPSPKQKDQKEESREGA